MIPDEIEKRTHDPVELRAVKDGSSLMMQLSRASAETEREELAREGWVVEVVDLPRNNSIAASRTRPPASTVGS